MRRESLTATAWSAADVAARQAIQLLAMIVLARLLTPAAFGEVAMLSVFTGVATTLVDGGFSTALIQARRVSRADESTVFWIGTGGGVVLAGVLAGAAHPIALFYDAPVVQSLAYLLAVGVVLASLGAVPAALLAKRLEFKTTMLCSAVAAVLSGASAIGLAAAGSGVWALGVQSVMASGVFSAMAWVVTGWRPMLTVSLDSAKRLFEFGGFVLAANLSDMIFSRLYAVLLGRLYGARAVGFYSRADSTQQIPVGLVSAAFTRSSLPLLASVADDRVRLRNAARSAVRLLTLVTMPLMFGLAALGEPLIVTVFGAQWTPSVHVFQVLCLAGALWPVHVVNVQLLLAQGHARLHLNVELVKKTVGIAVVGAGAAFGLVSTAWSFVAFGVLAFVVNAYYTGRFLDYGARSQLADLLPTAGLTLCVAAPAYVTVRAWHAAPAVELCTVGAAGAVAFLLIAHVVRLGPFRDAIALLRGEGVVPAGQIDEGLTR